MNATEQFAAERCAAHVACGEAPPGWLLVRQDVVREMLALIDSAPVEVDGKTYVFHNPRASEVLTRLSAVVRSMLDEKVD